MTDPDDHGVGSCLTVAPRSNRLEIPGLRSFLSIGASPAAEHSAGVERSQINAGLWISIATAGVMLFGMNILADRASVAAK
ncbi:MAG: hypothetical protein ACYC9Y_13810 [Candidatus Methylomirabilia bacterium]